MKYIFNDSFINGNEVIFYIFLLVILLIIVFASIATYKEIKNETK